MIIMSLDEKSEEWYIEFISRNPWVPDIVKGYGLDLSTYNLNEDTPHPPIEGVNRASFIEDANFLKTFDTYVGDRLTPDFSSVLEVGIGNWSYVSALATFFRKYSDSVPILGIDNSEVQCFTAGTSLQNRNVERAEIAFIDLEEMSREYDVVVNLCPNLISVDKLGVVEGEERPKVVYKDPGLFFGDIRKRISRDGLFVMGLQPSSSTHLSEEGMETVLSPFFKDIDINKNPYRTDKSDHPIDYIVTAKPKLALEMPQS